MYISAVVQIGLFTDVGTYTSARGGEQLVLDHGDFFYALALGMGAAAVGCVILALLLGRVVFGMRGPYFAIRTLGIALAARELARTWLWIGGGRGLPLPAPPGRPPGAAVASY